MNVVHFAGFIVLFCLITNNVYFCIHLYILGAPTLCQALRDKTVTGHFCLVGGEWDNWIRPWWKWREMIFLWLRTDDMYHFKWPSHFSQSRTGQRWGLKGLIFASTSSGTLCGNGIFWSVLARGYGWCSADNGAMIRCVSLKERSQRKRKKSHMLHTASLIAGSVALDM